MDRKAHDVVVIGGGHNGLVAACYLAKKGLDVAVVERAPQIGGMTASDTLIPEAPGHMVNTCSADLLFWLSSPVARDLDLQAHGLETIPVDPSYVYLHPDGSSIAVWKDPARTADEIRRFSPRDAAAYLDYARFLDKLFDVALPFMLSNPSRPGVGGLGRLAAAALRHLHDLPGFGSFLLSSGEEIIEQRFKHPITQALLYCLGAGANPIDAGGSAFTHLFLAFLHRGGTARPVGGMQAIPRALARRLTSLGGIIHTSSPVAEILLSNGRATGVRLEDGQELGASKAVVAACDPRTALGQLLPPQSLPPALETRVRHIPSSSAGAGAMKVDLALSGRVSLDRHERWRDDGLDLRRPAALIGTPDGIRRSYARAGAGIVPDAADIALWPVVLNAVDGTQAPAGQDSLYVFATTMPLDPEGGWQKNESLAADRVLTQLGSFYQGVDEMEIGRWIETPELAAQRTGATNGTAMHVDHLLLSQGPFRPARGLGRIEMPVDGLYLGSAGAHPGGGVTGMPGRLAAAAVTSASRHRPLSRLREVRKRP